MIGKHECKSAQSTDLKGAVAIGLDEAFTALEESFHDLSDEQAWAFPVPGHNNIAWIVMHTLDNLDEYANGLRSGRRVMDPDRRRVLWGCPAEGRPKPGDDFPSREEMARALRAVRDAALGHAGTLAERDLVAGPTWGPQGERNLADAYMRTIYHTMAHVRQVWLLRGALGLTDGRSWPQQHWA